MIEKVNITDANVVELIREKLPAATEANKGLMQANGFEQGKNILNEEYDKPPFLRLSDLKRDD